jgi:hypothetical protein
VDILRLPRRAFFYADPDASRRTASYVVEGDYVAVLRVNPDWYLVDFFGPRLEKRGWLRREDFVRSPWIAQRAATPRFAVSAACVEQDGHVLLEAVEVRDRKSGRRTQMIYAGQVIPAWGTCDRAVGFQDANFDGYPDLSFTSVQGMANSSESFYLFDPARERFVYDDALSSLSDPMIDAAKREIRAGWRNGAAEHQSERYRYVKGQLTLIESVNERCAFNDELDVCIVATRRLVRGVYVDTTTKRPLPP